MNDFPYLPVHALVDARFTGENSLCIDGIPRFHTVGAALAAAPESSTAPYRIRILAGEYLEKIVVDKPNIALLGQSRENTILSWDDFSGSKDGAGNSIGTWKCATLIIRAPGFHAENLTIANHFDYLGNDAKSSADPSKTDQPQAVALMTDKGSDCASFHNVCLLGYQDTLFVHSGRSHFQHCTIAGNIDFIFGAGQAFIDGCDIISRPRACDLAGEPTGYVTAPSTQLVDKYGIVIINSRLLKERDQVPVRSCPLGRPWHPTTHFPDGRYAHPNAIGMATFLNCWLDDHVTESGWDKMHGTARTPGMKDMFFPDNPWHARFFEFGNTGPGAISHPLRKQLSAEQAREFTAAKILRGWIPTFA